MGWISEWGSNRPSFDVRNYYFNYLLTKMPVELGYFQYFVQLPDIRKAIHVGSMKWNSGDEVRQKTNDEL